MSSAQLPLFSVRKKLGNTWCNLGQLRPAVVFLEGLGRKGGVTFLKANDAISKITEPSLSRTILAICSVVHLTRMGMVR